MITFRDPEIRGLDAGGEANGVTSRANFEVNQLGELFLRV
jgi:hypothetical protein